MEKKTTIEEILNKHKVALGYLEMKKGLANLHKLKKSETGIILEVLPTTDKLDGFTVEFVPKNKSIISKVVQILMEDLENKIKSTKKKLNI